MQGNPRFRLIYSGKEKKMKRILLLTLAGFFLLSFDVRAQDLTGRQIMDKQKERHKAKTEVGSETMILADKDGGKERRQVKRYSKEVEKDLHRYLIVFLAPADIKGTALLTWEQKGRENDQWLYLPAQKKMQRIAKGSKKNYFMGTDFTYEDLEAEDLDQFEYKVLRSEPLAQDGKNFDCTVIQAVPSNEEKKRESGYSKKISWVDKKEFMTLKIEFYDRRDKLQKVQTNHEMENVGGTSWRPKKTLMDHQEKGHQTLTGTVSRELNKPMDDSTFTERFILSGQHVE
jgi:hypothetical protein